MKKMRKQTSAESLELSQKLATDNLSHATAMRKGISEGMFQASDIDASYGEDVLSANERMRHRLVQQTMDDAARLQQALAQDRQLPHAPTEDDDLYEMPVEGAAASPLPPQPADADLYEMVEQEGAAAAPRPPPVAPIIPLYGALKTDADHDFDKQRRAAALERRKSKVLASTAVTNLTSSNTPPCDNCEEAPSAVTCHDCDERLCSACNETLHKGEKRRSHKRTGLAGADAEAPQKPCSYTSPRGKCSKIFATFSGNMFCDQHTCSKHGCVGQKATQDQFCGVHGGGSNLSNTTAYGMPVVHQHAAGSGSEEEWY
jgi:hypothetical protein